MNNAKLDRRSVAMVGNDVSVLRAAAIMRQPVVCDRVVNERNRGRWAPTGMVSDHDIAIKW